MTGLNFPGILNPVQKDRVFCCAALSELLFLVKQLQVNALLTALPVQQDQARQSEFNPQAVHLGPHPSDDQFTHPLRGFPPLQTLSHPLEGTKT